jgi:hypothetical protein
VVTPPHPGQTRLAQQARSPPSRLAGSRSAYAETVALPRSPTSRKSIRPRTSSDRPSRGSVSDGIAWVRSGSGMRSTASVLEFSEWCLPWILPRASPGLTACSLRPWGRLPATSVRLVLCFREKTMGVPCPYLDGMSRDPGRDAASPHLPSMRGSASGSCLLLQQLWLRSQSANRSARGGIEGKGLVEPTLARCSHGHRPRGGPRARHHHHRFASPVRFRSEGDLGPL